MRRMGEGTVFTGVCLSTPGGGGTPARVGTPPPGQGKYPHPQPGQISTTNTCCAAGGMPVAFTQDFIVTF